MIIRMLLFIQFVILQMNVKMNRSLSLAKVEQSILQQYKRLCFGEQNNQNEFITSIVYSNLPKYIPKDITKNNSKCMLLGNVPFFHMITYLIMEYLFRCKIDVRQDLIRKIRKSICDQNFLFGSGYIKGLLVKALRIIKSEIKDSKMPVVNYLARQEYILAFTQFWKEIIEMHNEEQFEFISDEIERVHFEQISNYLGISFRILWAENNYEEEIIYPIDPSTNELYCQIIIRKKNGFSSNSELLKTQQKEEPPEYIILLPYQRIASMQSEKSDSHQEITFHNTEEYILLKAKAWQAKKKGEDLVRQFREFWNIIKQF